MKNYCLIFLIFISFALAQDFKDCADEVLVLIDSWSNANAFSNLLNPLKERGFNVKLKLANDSSLSILRYGDYAYKNIFILAPNVRLFGGKLDVPSLSKFVDDGGNLLIAGDTNVGEAIRELASEFGVEFDAPNTAVIDHFLFDPLDDEGLHTRLQVPASNVIDSKVMVGDKNQYPLLYEGIGLAVNPSNTLLTEVVWASETSYSDNPSKPVKKISTLGDGTKLVVSFQGRNNNARVLMTGSIKLLSDQFILSKNCANKGVVQNLVRWLVHEQGVLRVKALKHHRVGESIPPWEYTIKDKVHFSVDIEFKNEEGTWVPYNANDVQLTLVRIDPFIRLNLPHTGNHYSTELILPDVYGVFKLVVDYRHTGYSHLYTVNEISIRPLKHTEYERFIPAAYPYYASAFSMLLGVFLLSFVYLYYKDDRSSARKKVD